MEYETTDFRFKMNSAIRLFWLLLCCAFSGLTYAQANVTGLTATSGLKYGTGQVVAITATFDAAVTVVGSPTLALNAGPGLASCAAVTNSITVTCNYTVAAGDSASPLDIASVNALALNSGTITTVAGGLAANLSLAAVTTALSASNVEIDTTAPSLAATIAVNNALQPNTIALSFSEPMLNNAALTTAANYTVTNNSNTITYSIASVTPGAIVSGGTSAVTLHLAAVDPSNYGTYITNAEIAAHLRITPSASLTDLAGNAIANTAVVEAGGTHTTDVGVPTLPANKIKANNTVQPNTVTLTFSEALANTAAVTDVSKYTLTNNGGTLTYTLASAAQTSPGVVTLTLAATTPGTQATYLTNADIAGHLKVALAAGFADLAGNSLVAATITEAGATPTTDSTAPTVVSTLAYVDSTHVKVSFSEMMNKTLAETAGHYTVSGTGTLAALSGAATSAVLASNGLDVTLVVPSLSTIKAGDSVKITVATAMADLAGRALTAPGIATFAAVGAPASFTFAPITGAPLKTAVASNSITVTGITVPTTLSVVSGSDSSLLCAIAPVATGVFSSFATCSPTTPLTVNNGDQIKLQLTSATAGSATVSGGISIGGVSGTFSVTTAPTLVVAGLTYTALTTLSNAITSSDTSISLSANGIVVVPSTVTAAINVVANAPANTAIILRSGGTYNFVLGALTQSVRPVGGDAIVTTKAFVVDGSPAINLLEVASGRAVINNTSSALPMASIKLGAGTVQNMISSVGSAAVSIDVQRLADGTGLIGVISGQISLRLPSSASTVAIADVATPLYSSEVASLSTAGKITGIRIGSVAGDSLSVVGDNLSSSIYPTGMKSRVKVPNLTLPLTRADPAVSLMQALFDFTGSRPTLTQTTQGANGQIPMLWAGQALYIMPYGDVTVDTTRADGITLASDGHFEVARNGVIAKLTTVASDVNSFVQAVRTTYIGGSVTMSEDGAYELSNNGKTLIMKPALVSQGSMYSGTLFGEDGAGQLFFSNNGWNQPLYPHFYDLKQLAAVLATYDAKVTLRDNLDGTVSVSMSGNEFTFTPLYEVLSPIGGVPPEHRADPWWVTDDVIYLKYSNGAAQGFRSR